MEFLGIMYLSYIHFAYSLYYTNLAYPKEICVKHAVMILLLLEPSITFHHEMWSCDFVTVTYAIILTPNSKFQNWK